MAKRVISLNWMRPVLVCLDLLVLGAGIIIAFAVRFDGQIPADLLGKFYVQALPIFPIAIAVFYAFGLYNRIWHFASVDALVSIILAVTTSALALLGSMYLFSIFGNGLRSYSLLTLTWMVWLFAIGAGRFSWRIMRELHVQNGKRQDSRNGHVGPDTSEKTPKQARRIIIYGAGSAGAALADQLRYQPSNGSELVGFVDDDPKKRNMWIRHGRVLGLGTELERICARHKCDEIIIAIPSLGGGYLRRLVRRCSVVGIPYRILPSTLQLWENEISFGQLRGVDLADLLGRDPTQFPVDTCGEYLRGKRVLVTGAGGSIGSEICRQAARFHPQRLILLGRGENRIHAIGREIERHYPGMSVPFIGNITNAASMNEAFELHAPEIVFHAAAHKHVPLMEPQPLEAIVNNVFGTDVTTDVAAEHGVERFVLISTDKAVHPTSVMGASKCICELLLQRKQQDVGLGTRYITVRFGNVIGSTGSVVEIFQDQIQRGEPLTITHPEATRYFMTIPEAALLVIHSGGIGEASGLYILDMGEPIRIQELAEDLLRLAGRDPKDLKNFRYIGLRPGEKLHEALYSDTEVLVRTDPHVLQVLPNGWQDQVETVDYMLARLREVVRMGNAEQAHSELIRMANNQYSFGPAMTLFAATQAR